MSSLLGRSLGAVVCCAALAVASDGPHADFVVSTNPGPGAFFERFEAVGPPSGQGLVEGSNEVYSLGVGGSMTLHMETPVVDGPGTDLIVSENPFFILQTDTVFIEAAYVEVSSNGTDFARFPTAFAGPDQVWEPFTGGSPAWFSGFAGVMPVSANPPDVTVFDPVVSGGDAFDLADLADHPLVQGGAVDLDAIEYVRLIDVVAGADVDSDGDPVWDANIGVADNANADIDALTGVNNACNQDPGRPEVELTLAPNGLLLMRIHDPDGIKKLKNGLRASVNGVEINFFLLAQFFVTTTLNGTTWEMLTGPVPPGMFEVVIKVSATDDVGAVRGDAVVIQ